MHPSLVPDCNSDGVTQTGQNPGKSYTNTCRWNGCHKFQRLDIDARLISSGFRQVGASHILKTWSYASPKQNYFSLKLMINKWWKPSILPTWRHAEVPETLRFITSFLKFPIFTEKGPEWGARALALLCALGMCRPQGYVFHNFCLEMVLFSGPIESGKGCVLILVWYRA